MTHKGYVGEAELDDEAGIFFGRVLNLRDVITFQGTTVADLRQSFRDSVDFYLDTCKADGVAPEKPYTGRILVRTTPEVQRALITVASAKGKSVNTIINGILTRVARKALTRSAAVAPERAKATAEKSALSSSTAKAPRAKKSARTR